MILQDEKQIATGFLSLLAIGGWLHEGPRTPEAGGAE